ncbi:MAG: NUDIX domain-containing protein [archaeon]|nr:MAG: NUDIX domain-containing protein [archaeon]
MDWSQFEKGVFLVNVLAIVYDPETKKILIGRRKKNDPYVKELTWCFPGGRPGYEQDLEHYLKEEVRKKTGLEVEVKKLVFAKTYPENREVLSIYFLTRTSGGKEEPGDKLVELKWVKPTEVRKYFTTSLHPKVLDFLKKLEVKE